MRPRSPSLEEWRDEPFSPEAVAWRPGPSWTVGSSPWFVTAAADPFLVERCILLSRMTVGTALSSAKCTFQRRAASGEAGVAACGPCSLAGVPVVVVDRPVAPLPGARGGAGCPNLPQRPGSGRSAGGESLIFRASAHRRSRPGAPLWQIWTRPPPRIIPGATPAPSHARSSPTPRRPRPLSRQSCEVRLNEPFSSGESSSGVLRGDAGRSRRSSSPAHAMRAQLAEIHLSSHNVSSARQNPSELNSCELSSHNVS